MPNFYLIKQLCAEKNITQEELALRIGVSRNTISKMISLGSTSLGTQKKVADFFGVPESYFYVDVEKKIKPYTQNDAPTDMVNGSAGNYFPSNLEECMKENQNLKREVEYLKKINRLLEDNQKKKTNK